MTTLIHERPVQRSMLPRNTAPQRFIFVDSVRGIAALGVAFYHIYGQLCVPSGAPLWPRPLHVLLSHGYLGVFVFFVLSGMVIACSLHNVRIDASLVGKFALRRSLRLDPTYWLTIFVTFLSLLAISSVRGGQRALVSVADIVENMFYLDNLLECRSIVKVGWTLCLEIQFYLAFVLLAWLAWFLRGSKPGNWLRGAIFVPLGIWSLLVYAEVLPLPHPGIFVPYWFMYFLGVLVWWSLCGEVPRLWFWCGIGACCVLGTRLHVIEVWVATVTALVLYLVGRYGRMDVLLTGKPFRYLGKISYSLYLVHPLVGVNFLRLAQRLFYRWGYVVGPFDAVFWFLAATAVSVGAAHIMYKLVESPSHRLSRRIQWTPLRTT